MPGANGQGRTIEECRQIALVLEDRRDDALRGVASDALREVVVVELVGG